MIALIRSLTPLAKRIIGGAILVALLAILFTLQQCSTARTAKTEAKLSGKQAEAAMQSGTDAVETVGRTIEYERHVDYITRENERAIQTAPGADAPVDPDLARVARERLCQRAAYHQHPDCVQRTPAE